MNHKKYNENKLKKYNYFLHSIILATKYDIFCMKMSLTIDKCYETDELLTLNLSFKFS